LEFTSETRGVDSGGTGRIELWEEGTEMIIADPIRLLFGHGFRSAEAHLIGISLESSYLTLLFEVGLFATVGFLLCVYFSILKSLKISDLCYEGGVGIYYSVAMCFIFILFQSIFNRYLVSIGNFFSVFFFLLLFRIFLENGYKIKIIK
jgi:O-antigen ligase